MVAIAIGVGLLLARRNASQAGLRKEEVVDLALVLALAGLVGARILYVILEPAEFAGQPARLVNLSMGGMSIHGALAGGLIAGYVFARAKRASFARLADLLAVPLIAGQAIGRIGCFLNGDSYGKLASVPWAVTFPNLYGARHPTQLYESALAVVALVLLVALSKRLTRPGHLFLAYLIAYSAIRFFVELFRESEYLLPSLTYAQAASVAIAAVALLLMLLPVVSPRLRRRSA